MTYDESWKKDKTIQVDLLLHQVSSGLADLHDNLESLQDVYYVESIIRQATELKRRLNEKFLLDSGDIVRYVQGRIRKLETEAHTMSGKRVASIGHTLDELEDLVDRIKKRPEEN